MPKPAKVVDTFVAAPLSVDPRFTDLTGHVFDRLTVVNYAGKYEWNCLCACGTKVVIRGGHLKNGNTKSCGCLHKEWVINANTRHGEASRDGITPEYRAYHQAKDRCTNPEYHAYGSYGGRGIEFKFQSVQQFVDHIGRRPSSKHTLDRINVNGNYEVGNVRWATMREQNRNRSDHRYVTIDGITRCVADWADEYSISPDLVYDRRIKGWCEQCAIITPVNHRRRACVH